MKGKSRAHRDGESGRESSRAVAEVFVSLYIIQGNCIA